LKQNAVGYEIDIGLLEIIKRKIRNQSTTLN